MANIFPLRFGDGCVTSRPSESLSPNELQTATGGWYPPGSRGSAIHKIDGRSAFGTALSGQAVKGLELCLFDTAASDAVLAYAGSGLYAATPGTTGAFTELYTEMSAADVHFHAAHWNDEWYLAHGAGQNLVYNGSTVRVHGMLAPTDIDAARFVKQVPSETAYVATAHAISGTEFSSQFRNMQYAYNDDPDLYGTVVIDTSGICGVVYSGFALAADLDTLLVSIDYETQVRFTSTPRGFRPWDDMSELGDATTSRQAPPTYRFYTSTDYGATWDQALESSWKPRDHAPVQLNLSGVTNTSGLQVKLEFESTVAQLNFYAMKVFYIDLIGAGGGVGDPTVAEFSTDAGGMYYGVTEYDDEKQIESNAWRLETPLTFTSGAGYNAVKITLPSGSMNPNTDRYRIYRTTDGGVAPQDLGFIGDVEISADTEPIFVDRFKTYDKDTIGTPKYSMLRIVESDGEAVYYDLDTVPVPWSHINTFQGSLVGIDYANQRQLWYTPPGKPESSPEPYVIRSFPLKEHDQLVGTVSVGDSLVILANGAVMELRGLPLVESDGVFQLQPVRAIEGQPGCVGSYAFCSLSTGGSPTGAWVSRYGVHITNGTSAERISDEVDWDATVNVATLSSAVLEWDAKRQILSLDYDSDGDGVNDRYLLFHMREIKDNGLPKWTGPHYGQRTDVALGVTSEGVHRMYSAHPSDGKVYLEWNGTTDESNAYDGSGTLPMILKTGRHYREDYGEFEVFKINLMHSDWGAGQTAALALTYGRDQSNDGSWTLSKTVALNGFRGTEVFIGRSMEWVEIQLTHTAAASGQLIHLRNAIEPAGESGSR